MMYFIIGCLSITVGMPIINNNPFVKFGLMMVILWGLILVQQKGTQVTGKIAQWCFSLGVIVPVMFY